MSDLPAQKSLPLHSVHVAAGAKFGAFAGWSMPTTYPAGVLKEHLHTRSAAGLFDISHMKLVAFSGPDAARFLSYACPVDAAGLANGQSKYTFLLDARAGILDDLIVTRLAADRFMVVANAGNADNDIAEFRLRAAGHDVVIDPLDRVFLALQGPSAEEVAQEAGLPVSGLTFMTGRETPDGHFLTRSGYTGEDGFEIAVPPERGAALAEALLASGKAQWIGLAARDSLRLEAGLCLHGHEIDVSTTPLDAQLMWAIARPLRETGTFIGAEALRQAIAAGPSVKRVGLRPEGRQPVRDGAVLVDENGKPAGRVTSGGFGPSFNGPVAMGLVRPDIGVDARLLANVRGQMLPVVIHPLPFVPHNYRKG